MGKERVGGIERTLTSRAVCYICQDDNIACDVRWEAVYLRGSAHV